MLQLFMPAEGLPVGIFNPSDNHRLIRFIKGMLKIMQTDHQPNRIAGPSHIFAVTIGKLSIKPRPVNSIGLPAQFVVKDENLLEGGAEQLKLVG